MTCTHEHVTLCRGEHPEFGPFSCWQCDTCGMMLAEDAPVGDFETLPALDLAAYDDALDLRNAQPCDVATLGFFSRAIHKNGSRQ